MSALSGWLWNVFGQRCNAERPEGRCQLQSFHGGQHYYKHGRSKAWWVH